MLPQPIIDLLTTAFPDEVIGDVVPTVGGFSHRTATVTIGGRRCVVKAADASLKRADVRHEAHMLSRLSNTGLPVPSLYALVEDTTWTVEVMRAVDGTNAIHFFTGVPVELEAIYRALGRLIAAVHSTTLMPSEPSLSVRARQVRETLLTLALEPDVQDILVASLTHPAWHPAEACLVHGDAGIHNVLWDGQITALLDWEWAGWGNPLLDLSWIFWTMRWRKVPDELWQTLLASYGTMVASQTQQAMQALVFGQMASILIRVQEQPAAWQEWLRRVRWTMDLVFPTLDVA